MVDLSELVPTYLLTLACVSTYNHQSTAVLELISSAMVNTDFFD